MQQRLPRVASHDAAPASRNVQPSTSVQTVTRALAWELAECQDRAHEAEHRAAAAEHALARALQEIASKVGQLQAEVIGVSSGSSRGTLGVDATTPAVLQALHEISLQLPSMLHA